MQNIVRNNVKSFVMSLLFDKARVSEVRINRGELPILIENSTVSEYKNII